MLLCVCVWGGVHVGDRGQISEDFQLCAPGIELDHEACVINTVPAEPSY